jgi:replicative DNA helicase Mcm
LAEIDFSNTNNNDTVAKEEPVQSVSETLRIIPNTEEGETTHTQIVKVRGMISSMRPVMKMISGEYGRCLECGELYYERYEKPLFEMIGRLTLCNNNSEKHTPATNAKTGDVLHDKDGNIIRAKAILRTWPEYRNASIIELQDQEKFDDLERLQVILFDDDTRDVCAGEQVQVTGQIYFEKFSRTDSKINSRLYSHSIIYEARREISLSSMDVDAIKRFVARHGNNTVDKLVELFAPKVVGFWHVKKGLLLCSASCCNDTKKSRVRMHSLLVGDPGNAKSMLVRETVEIVPNSRFESAQNSSGKSLTAIVSKEGRESTTVLRLGPIPFAKEAICGLNELGRMSFDDQAPLLDVMEEGEFSINKYGMNAHIRSPTVIIGSANPTGSKWRYMSSDGRINMDDIPAIKPLLDRFDYVFIIKTSRDEEAIRQYANTRAKYEDIPVPNYNPYLEKHLIYAKRFNPKMSKEATTMLNEYYIGIAKMVGSSRVRDTVFKTAKMIARLKLKNVVDADDVKEACQFYNVVLNEYDQIVNIPGDPRDVAFIEILNTIESAQTPIIFEEAVSQTCKRNEYVATYIGNDYKLRTNKKLRPILDRLLEDSRIKRVQVKPTILQWISENQPKKDIHTGEDKKNTDPSYNVVTNVTNVTKSLVHTMSEMNDSKDKDSLKNLEGKYGTGAHRAHRAHSALTTPVRANHVDETSDTTEEVLSSIWPTAKINKISNIGNLKKYKELTTASDTSDTSDLMTSKLDLKHTRAAVIHTNDDLASEDDS